MRCRRATGRSHGCFWPRCGGPGARPSLCRDCAASTAQAPRGLRRPAGRAGHEPFVVSRLRSFDGAGDARHQARIAARGQRTAERLLRRWRERPETAPELWFTYHLYYKAPDWLGPAASAALGIPYVAAEASYAGKRAAGPWADGHRAVERAVRRADAVVGLNSADRDGVLPLLRDPARWIALPPFLDAAAYPARDPRRADAPRLIVVAMMRHGDKLESYRLLAAALARLLDLPSANR